MRITIPILLTAFLILTSSILYAQSITINTAKEIAKNHMQTVSKGNLKSAGPSRTKFQFSTAATSTENNDTLYFVLNDSINKSFVIVSADRRAYPIIGYSLEGNFDEANQPPAFVEWMENRKQEIAYIKKNNLQADSKTTQQWDNLSSVNYLETATTVGPLLQTKWNQGCYYNALCPTDAAGPCSHALTGCVATSMAQIRKYWNYPITGTGSRTYTHATYGALSADFGATTYQWTLMTNSVSSQNDAVATLMYHCGIAVNMNYGPDASSAGMSPTSLENYFNYSTDAVYVWRSDYTENNWINLLKLELDSHRPIWYRGDGPVGGHAFVCDGYDANNKFHINWGWGGSADGYFLIGALSPDAPNGYTFNNDQAAIIKVFPAKVPDAIGSITGLTEVCAGQTAVTYSVPAIQNAASYTWTLPTGATGTSTTNSITVTFGATAQSGSIKVKAQNSLGTTAESSLAVTVNALPTTPGAISGKTMVCPSVSETYSIAAVTGAVNYTWELPTGWTGSSTSTSITVTTGVAGGTIKVKANNAKCSGASSSLVVSIGTPTSPTSVSASLTTVTPGQSTTLQVNGGALNSAPNWIWYTGSCGGTQVGTGSTLTVSPIVTTTYYVQATGCGTATTCKSITITYCSAPSAPASSSASIGSPANGTSHKINFYVPTVIGADGYMWDYSLDGVAWVANWYDTSCAGTCTNYVDFGDKPNIPVYFRVRAYKCSPKQYSNYTYTLPKPIYTACDVPASPIVNGATSSSLNLTLNTETPVANPAITTYSIYCTTTSQYLQSNGTLGSTEVFQTKSAWGTKTITGLTGNTQYCFYAKAKNNDGDIRYSATNATCGTTVCTAPVTPTSATASLTTISAGQSTNLQVNGGTLNSAPNWVWYSGSCGGTQVGTGTTLLVSPNTTTTYYVMATACGTSTTCKSVTVTVCTAPVSPTSATASSTSITSGQSTTLQVNGGTLNSAPGWIWYTGSCGGTQVGTGASLVVSPTTTKTYYVQATACGTSTTCKSVTITVTSCTAPVSPSSATASSTSITSGQSTTLQVNGGTLNSAPGWIWYTGSCGGTQIGTGASLVVSPAVTTTYYVQATACGVSTTCKSVTITVTNCTAPTTPTSATASLTTITSGQSTTLQVNGGTLNSAPGWIWYTGSCGGTQVGTGASLVVSPAVTTTYYVQATACGTNTTCKSVTITVNPTSCIAPSAPATCTTSIGNPANGLEHTTNLSCSIVSGADGYFFEYSFDGILWNTDWGGDPGYSWQINLHDSPNIPIYYRVRAYKCTPALYSSYTYASPKPIYTACDVPSVPTINQGTSSSLSIALNTETPIANPAITTYSIYCTTTSQYVQANGTLGNTEVFQTKSTWGTKTITGLSANTQYCFYAKAKNYDGDIRFNALNSACGTTANISPTASFSANQVEGCSPLTVNFTDVSTGTPTSWTWDIDNNGSVDYTIKNPTHTYSKAGTYTVKLTVTNVSGTSTMTRTNYITVNSATIAGVTISASPSSTITPGQLVAFTATPSNGGTNPTYQWKVQGSNVGTNSPTYSTSTLTNGQVVTCVMSSSLPCANPALATSNSITMSVGVSCTAPIITSNPNNQYKTAPESASFSITASGSDNLYQWQYNKGNGWTNVPVDFQHSGVSTSKLSLSSTSMSMNGYQYRCYVSSSCSINTAISSSATLVVYSLNGPTLTVTPPAIPAPTVFTIGLKFNVPVTNVPNGITVVGGKLENVSGSGDTYTITVSAEEQTTVSIVLSDAIRDQSPNMNKFAGQTLTYTIGDFTKPQLIYWNPNNETIQNNHPLFNLSFSENVKLGSGGLLKVCKVGTSTSTLNIPITSGMITGKNINVGYSSTQNGLNKNTWYYVILDNQALTDLAGNSFDGITDIATWTFKTGAAFATGNEFNEIDLSTIKVYPNPTTGIINIEGLPLNQKSKISVFAANGDLVVEKTTESDKDKIDISKQVPGTYFLQINKQSIKIIKE